MSSLGDYVKQNFLHLRAEHYGVQHEEIVSNSINCLEQIEPRNMVPPGVMLEPWFAQFILLHAQASAHRYPIVKIVERRVQYSKNGVRCQYKVNKHRSSSLVHPHLTDMLNPALTRIANRTTTMFRGDLVA